MLPLCVANTSTDLTNLFTLIASSISMVLISDKGLPTGCSFAFLRSNSISIVCINCLWMLSFTKTLKFVHTLASLLSLKYKVANTKYPNNTRIAKTKKNLFISIIYTHTNILVLPISRK